MLIKFGIIQKRWRMILKKIKEMSTKNKKITVCAAALICVLIVTGIVMFVANRTADIKR